MSGRNNKLYLIRKISGFQIVFGLRILIVSVLILAADFLYSQGLSRAEKLSLARQLEAESRYKKEEAERMAREKGWVIRQVFPDGRIIELMELGPNGIPQYYTTFNAVAAATTNTDDLWVGGSSGLNLTGSGFRIGQWEGGGVRASHREFDDDGIGSRVTKKEAVANSSHATHVAGTMIAKGVTASAKGMATQARIDAYEWTNDLAEMVLANANQNIILSNHSYGYVRGWTYDGDAEVWKWYGDTTINGNEDYQFGFYCSLAKQWDSVACLLPEYLFVKAAGNDRGEDHHGEHYIYRASSGRWVKSSVHRDPDGGLTGYDCIGNNSNSKNILVIGACQDIPSGYSQPSDVLISDFSGWGPTDDGRIKPDLVANGSGLYSCDMDADNDYTTKSGTSMAAPNVTGTLALLQSYYYSLHGAYMMADELKALVINTASEAGAFTGPDYKFGWGLLNATGATDLIHRDDSLDYLLFRASLSNSEIDEYVYYSDGNSPIKVTVCWSDPPHNALNPSLDPSTKILINDLDLRLITPSGTTQYPWVLDPGNPGGAPSTGDNDRDNVETIYIDDPPYGEYKIRILHEGTLTSTQSYALAISGLQTQMFTNTWTGNSSSDLWYAHDNWSMEHDPCSVEKTVIPAGLNAHPVIDVISAKCYNLTAGGDVIIEIYDDTLFVEHNFSLNGQLLMNYTNSFLSVKNNMTWGFGSSANITAACVMHIYGDWTFHYGANVDLTKGFVVFMGAGISNIQTGSTGCSFRNLIVNKEPGGSVVHVSGSSAPLKCHGYFLNWTGNLESTTSQSIIVEGDYFSNQDVCNLTSGTVIMDGTDQSIAFGSPGYFNNLTISPTIQVTLTKAITIHGQLKIESGIFNTNDKIVNIEP
jgi:hypothetical protein